MVYHADLQYEYIKVTEKCIRFKLWK